MNNCLNSDDIEKQENHKNQTKMEVSNEQQNISDESNLPDDLQKVQRESNDQTKPNELQSREDLHQLSEQTHKQDSKVVATTKEELPCDHEIFGNLLVMMKAYANNSKQEKLGKSIFIDEWQIFKEFLNVMEKHEKNLTDEDILVADKGFRLFIHSTDNINPDILFRTTLNYAKKEIFYMYFNLINLTIIQNYLKNVQMIAYLKRMCRYSVSRILSVIRVASIVTDLNLNDVQRPNNCIELLSLMLNYVRTDLESSDLTSNPSPNEPLITTYMILLVIWEYTDKTVLVRDVIDTGYLKVITDGLAKICKTEKVVYGLKMQIISIIHNICRHDDGKKELNALNTVDLIKIFQTQQEDHELNIKCCMILALLLTPEQIKNDPMRMNSVLDSLLKMLYNASVSSDYRDRGFYISEPLIVLVKLFNDEHTLDYIMEHSQVDLHKSSTVEFFVNLLIDYHSKISNDDPMKQETCTAIVNILWSVSFQEKYKQMLKQSNTKFKELIQNFSKGTENKIASNLYESQYIENIQKAATGLLVNIDELVYSTSEHVESVSTKICNNEKPLIMISYSHKNIEFCQQLHDEIIQRGFDTWIDFQFLKTGDLWEQIAGGMTRANIIICLMSEDYCESKSCKLEATYAIDKLHPKKPIIPVLLQKFQLPLWADIRITPFTYIRFNDSKKLEQAKLSELIDAIEYSLPLTRRQTDVTVHPSASPSEHEPVSIPTKKINEPSVPTTKVEKKNIASENNPDLSTTTDRSTYPKKPIEQWNENDISQWFQHNEILPELRDLCRFKDGYELMAYARIFLETEKLQYQMYSDEFSRLDGITFGQRPLLLHEFTKFSNALRKLPKFKKTT